MTPTQESQNSCLVLLVRLWGGEVAKGLRHFFLFYFGFGPKAGEEEDIGEYLMMNV